MDLNIATAPARVQLLIGLLRRRSFLQQVPLSTPSHDEILAEFLPHVGNMYVHEIREAVVVFVEQVVVEHAPGDQFAPVQRQEFHESVFPRRQADGLTALGHALADRVDLDIADLGNRASPSYAVGRVDRPSR